jgi:hypothetical protein
LDEIGALEFDSRNLEHLARHGLDDTTVWDILLGEPAFFEQVLDSSRSGTHLMVGPASTGRHWTVVIVEVEPRGTWRPITGWPSTTKELRQWRENR